MIDLLAPPENIGNNAKTLSIQDDSRGGVAVKNLSMHQCDSEEDALDLLKNSTVFDQFVTDAINDYEQFSIAKKESDVKNSRSTSATTSKQEG